MMQVLLAIAVMGLLVMVATGATVVVVVRRVRRRYRSLRGRLLGTRLLEARAPQPDLTERLRAVGPELAASIGSPGWWVVQNRRRRLWRAVTSAEQAVRVASKADAALGDLRSLVVRLRIAADRVDAVLRASGPAGSVSAADRRDCEQIITAAGDIRDAAMSSLRIGSHADTETVVDAVRLEVTALDTGLRAAHR